MNSKISDIIYRELSGNTISAEDKDILSTWLAASSVNRDLYSRLSTESGLKEELKKRLAFVERQESAFQQFRDKYFLGIDDAGVEYSTVKPAHRTPFFRSAWFRYAAAILLVLGTVTYLWNPKKKDAQPFVTAKKPLQMDIEPGGQKATLTLADGTQITLDSAANGTLAQQGTASITKLANGQISYSLKGKVEGPPMMNTMSTPRGGQYKLILPDGTVVWLNSSSSITYPAMFVGNERKVQVSGEVYFEVTKDASKPFLASVHTSGLSLPDLQIQVLGTHFNVMAYPDETEIKATLVEGKIKAVRNTEASELKEGQQAQLNRSSTKIEIKEVDTEEETAWITGHLVLNNSDIGSIMRKISRWYDVDVRYLGSESKRRFNGVINRNINLSQMITLLKANGIESRLEGRTMFVEL